MNTCVTYYLLSIYTSEFARALVLLFACVELRLPNLTDCILLVRDWSHTDNEYVSYLLLIVYLYKRVRSRFRTTVRVCRTPTPDSD
jgi:hypothetical protein